MCKVRTVPQKVKTSHVNNLYKNNNFSNRLFQAWFLDDGVLAGKKASVLWAVSILEEFGPSLGIFINLTLWTSILQYG